MLWWVFGGLSALSALAAVALFVAGSKRSLASRHLGRWLPRSATITSVGFESRGDRGIVRLVFDVEGRSSSALDIGDEPRPMTERQDLLERFASGTVHPALVDPTGSAPPVLVTGLAQPKARFVVGAIFLLLSLVLLSVGAMVQGVLATLHSR